MSTGGRKWSQVPTPRRCNTVFLWLRHRLPCLGESRLFKERVPTVNCSVWHWPRPIDRPVSDSYTLSQQTISVVWSYDKTPRYCINDAPLSQSHSPAWQAKHVCYVINVCAIETRFRLQLPLPTLRVCLLMCVPCPVPVQCTGAGTARAGVPGKQRVVVSSAVLSHAYHTTWQ